MITVEKLRSMLTKYNDNDVIILLSDGEGNNYSLLFGIEENAVFNKKDREYAGLRKLTKELEDVGFSEEDVAEKSPHNVNAILLYPE